MSNDEEKMDRFAHGGDTYGKPSAIDFSASLNPLGMPIKSVSALIQGVKDYGNYPDPQNRELLAGLAEFEDVPVDQIVVTAGGTDAFWRIAQVLAPKRVLVCDPCFSGYEESVGPDVEIVHHALDRENKFDVTAALADDVVEGIDIVYLCTPNNPTGRAIDREVLVAVLDQAKAVGAYVVLDECFADLADVPSAKDLRGEYPQLIIVKAFTKTYAMAGLRVGYCLCADEELVARLRSAGMPWVVSTPAQIAAVEALKDAKFISRSQRTVREQRDYLYDELLKLRLKAISSQANFILFESSVPLYEDMLERGFVIRRCENFCGLDEHWYRIAVRAREQNTAFIAALQEVLDK